MPCLVHRDELNPRCHRLLLRGGAEVWPISAAVPSSLGVGPRDNATKAVPAPQHLVDPPPAPTKSSLGFPRFSRCL